ncbi:MAG: hypothetical protein PVJ89_13925, partial [Planctomycetota bacterium]
MDPSLDPEPAGAGPPTSFGPATGLGPSAPREERERLKRLFEVLGGSIEVALRSGDPETARARADLARRTHGELVAAGLPEEILGSLAAFMEELEARFPTAWRLNAAARL